MKKHLLILLMVMLWASAAPAQQSAEPKGPVSPAEVFEGLIGPTYHWVSQEGSERADEYDYLKSTVGGNLQFEYDPLPQRFGIETHYISQKDYFGELDYAYRDVVLVNFLTRGVYHNLDHFTFAPDDPATAAPSFTDLNPEDLYATENQLRKGFIRFKTPDFPFHLYADATTTDREGKVQQRFLRGFTGGLNLVSQTRAIDWNSQEARVGANSHFGPVEFDYSHTERKFKSLDDKVLFDAYSFFSAPHDLTPDLTSSSDTIKLHTSFTGRITASGTYSDGTKKNPDSSTRSDFRNTAGDLTLTPFSGMFLVLKYRHYDLTMNDPATVTVAGIGNTYNVRSPISSKRDVMSGTARYRITPRLSVKGEYTVETTQRDVFHGADFNPLQTEPVPAGTGPNDWEVAHRTLKSTEKLGVSYRIMNKLSLRADYSAAQVTNPAYAADPDRVNSGKATLTWMPVPQVIALASYGGVREKRNNLAAPLAGGSRQADRDQALASLTILAGKRSSITASYMLFKNKTRETLTFTDTSGIFTLEDGVPSGDRADVVSLAASQAIADGVTFTADASKSFSRGNFRLDGSVPNTEGIDLLSDTRVVEDIYSAGLEIQFNRNAGGDVRYQHRQYDDQINNTQDGRVNTALATLYVKW
jgi:hypothetical protein